MTTLTNQQFKTMDGDAMINWLDDYVANLDERDPFYEVFKKQLARNKESAAKLKETQLELDETNERLRKGLKSYCGQFVSFEDEETVPYLLDKYKDNLLELAEYIEDVEKRFIDLHCKVYPVKDFNNVYLDNITCCADYYYENYDKFEETKGISNFIGGFTYVDMLHKAGEIDNNRLVELCIGLFKDHESNDDSYFACVTDWCN